MLLDVDGTLLDSNDAHARSWVDVLRSEGFDVAFERVRRLIGKGGDKLVPELTGIDPESERYHAISERRAERFLEHYLPSLRPFPGVRALVERLRRQGLALVVATSSRAKEADALLEAAGVADLLARRTSSDDADESKPDPDIVQAALRRAKLAPSEAILIGDTPYDLEAAARAGVAMIALRCGGWDDASLAGAIAIYDDPADLLAGYERSPLAR
ncbi:hydrolase, haloacid dehalogenase-like family [Sandaracinus amylolyticus]|uniref:Hydrolase, haloacid dehalogenase-like family n=1 Tax=Sandaracinus amylolyticus TaxID=927083 RepID=A0A0F6VYR1_9BACT|nr:hydrolase, haloacid dehalogenase-like family [Sandaracinus amylolyticus]